MQAEHTQPPWATYCPVSLRFPPSPPNPVGQTCRAWSWVSVSVMAELHQKASVAAWPSCCMDRERVSTVHVNAAAERCDVREAAVTLKHWNDSSPCVTAWEAPPPPPPHSLPPVCGGMAPEQSGMQASARPRSVSPQAAAWSRYLLQWVDQEPILFVAHIGISASNLRSTDSSKPSFLFEQTDLCFSLWRFVCHTNWLCLPLAVTVFSRERPRSNLPLGNSALANTFRKKCTYCYWKAADTILWRSFVQSLSFPLLFLSPTEIHSSKFSPPNTHIHREHNKRLIFWKDSVCPVILLRADKTGTEKKSQIEAKQREDREREAGRGRQRKGMGGESVPSGLVASPPAGFGGRYGWSLTLWQGPARRWPAPHSESIWTQTPSPRLFLAPCPRTCNTEKQTNKSARGVEKTRRTITPF